MRAFLIAGEPSGDALGGALMAGLTAMVPGVSFDGIGGDRMRAEGLQSRFEMSELSVMGIAEVLPRYRHLKRRIAEMAAAVIETRPDVLITIDSPDFCLRVAKLVKAQTDIRTVHYVAPSVWAWRPGRAAKMARSIDQVLTLLPFEPPLMQAAGMRSDFVGHPIVSEPLAGPEEVAAFRAARGLTDAAPLLLVLPGSRRGEIARLGPVFGQAVARFMAAHPEGRAMSVIAPGAAEHFSRMQQQWEVPLEVVPASDPGAKRAAFAAADLALAASGTVALELAAAATPMVIGYRMNWLSFQLIRRMALIDKVNLVNIVTGTDCVPELLGPDCTPERLSAALEAVRATPEAQQAAMAETMTALGKGGENPGARAARAVLDGLQSQ